MIITHKSNGSSSLGHILLRARSSVKLLIVLKYCWSLSLIISPFSLTLFIPFKEVYCCPAFWSLFECNGSVIFVNYRYYARIHPTNWKGSGRFEKGYWVDFGMQCLCCKREFVVATLHDFDIYLI